MPNGSKYTDKQWYYAAGGERRGPVPAAELTTLYNNGGILKDDLVWTPGMTNWAPANEVEGRFTRAADLAPKPAVRHAGGDDAYQPARPSLDLSRGVAAVHTPINMNYAGFWIRFAAVVLDAIILTIIQLPVMVGLTFMFFSMGMISEQNPAGSQNAGMLINLASFVVAWLYYALQESGSRSATFGKRITGLCVTDLDGYPIGFGRATARFFSKIVSSICLIGYLMQPFTARKQALHDIIAGCVVIRSR